MARRAKATTTLLAQVDMAAPLRSKSSDGWIGDAAHAASKSDHNPNSAGVVQAQDITHDPHGGFDSYLFAEHLRTHPDPRLKYVISNRKIFAGDDGPQPWAWRSYGGKNPHDMHVHVSVEDELYDDPRPWDIGFTVGIPDPAAPTISLPTLRVGAEGFYVELLQTLLGKTGAAVDGDFGPVTRDSLTQFQRDHKLDDDGICGPYSWRELLRPWAKEVGLLPRDPKAKLVEMAAVAQQTGSTASVDELITAYLAILEDILPPGYLLEEKPEPPPPPPDEDQYHAVVSGGYSAAIRTTRATRPRSAPTIPARSTRRRTLQACPATTPQTRPRPATRPRSSGRPNTACWRITICSSAIAMRARRQSTRSSSATAAARTTAPMRSSW